jgi:N-acetylglucosamine-6-phosphate deacetylase
MAGIKSSAQKETFLLRGARVLSGGEDLGRPAVFIAAGRIAAIGPEARKKARGSGCRRLDLSGYTLAPGFVDLHTHGAAGVDFVEATAEEFEFAMQHYLAHGVTSLLVSLYPTSWAKSLKVLERVSGFIRQGHGLGVAFGIHLEGPFVSPARPGALPRSYFRKPSLKELRQLLAAGDGLVRTMTLAPELKGGKGLIQLCRKNGVVPAFGHSNSDYEGTRRAISQGIRYATHLFNAMNGIHHRAPGAVTALLEDPRVSVELISDGHHVDPPALRLVNRLKSEERIILVSDSIEACGLADGRHQFAGVDVYLEEGVVRQKNGTLAGSALTLERALEVQVKQAGEPLEKAVRYCTLNPAKAAGISRRAGVIAVGRRADLVLLDSKFRVKATWLGGALMHSRGRLP